MDNFTTSGEPAQRLANMAVNKMTHASFSLDELQKMKKEICSYQPYADRMSVGFALRLIQLKATHREHGCVLREIDFLEGLVPTSTTVEASQFKRRPLHPFWHKHFYAPRHFWRNLGNRWGLTRGGNQDLTKMINEVAQYGHVPEVWQNIICHMLVVDGYTDRAHFGLTGDWIIFAKHNGENFYLDLASHEEGDAPETLITKLRQGSAAEFPFLFEQTPM